MIKKTKFERVEEVEGYLFQLDQNQLDVMSVALAYLYVGSNSNIAKKLKLKDNEVDFVKECTVKILDSLVKYKAKDIYIPYPDEDRRKKNLNNEA